ncbi:glycosyltransferase [Nitrospinaceae bacterium]|nr:glycosyltransferase [Nitrospinaceae bacterium]
MKQLIKSVGSPKFTVVLHTYNRPAFLRQSASAVLEQTYDNLEIILINNGATVETRELLHELESKDKRIRLLHFKENQYSPSDPHKIVSVCYNSALEMSTGNYIWLQDDDDILAMDYIEKMVTLFQGNTDCSSASGLVLSIDAKGDIIGCTNYRASNYRPRYMPGHILALDVLKGSSVMYGYPGPIFSFKRDTLLKYGGCHKAYELHHLYGIVPFGITGFDETAYFYWRRHEGQLNKTLTAQGWIGTKDVFSLSNNLRRENKWSIYGDDTAKYVVKKIKDDHAKTAAGVFALNFFSLRIKASMTILRDIWFYPHFWLCFPKALFRTRGFLKQWYLISRPVLKPLLNHINRNYPELKNKSVFFNKLIKHL